MHPYLSCPRIYHTMEKTVGPVGAEPEEIPLQQPTIHIVRPLQKHLVRGVEHPTPEEGHILVGKPVQLIVTDDVPSFREKFPQELFTVVSRLRDEGVRKMRIIPQKESRNRRS
jgi:hypothetical protein